eukprot:TRINITY_DN5909_c0_g1_i3.p2 TRINITY_DN5909_c0_g1~~TRINITY_DN5909_c0_g1_i3.p2  ORF type:complete len:158 (-),score=6.85 TRINITY_DN5909_c0_g1_i3:113-586(-)
MKIAMSFSILGMSMVYFCFAFGSVLMKYALQTDEHENSTKLNPVVFSFYREIFAGLIMTGLAHFSTGVIPKQEHLLRIGLLGFSLFANQLFYILGVDFAGVFAACCMQPVIPVFTVALAVLIQQEKGDVRKFTGILFGVLGALAVVIVRRKQLTSRG